MSEQSNAQATRDWSILPAIDSRTITAYGSFMFALNMKRDLFDAGVESWSDAMREADDAVNNALDGFLEATKGLPQDDKDAVSAFLETFR